MAIISSVNKSLYEKACMDGVLIKRNVTTDSEGNIAITESDGEKIRLALTIKSRSESDRAKGRAAVTKYLVTVDSTVELKHHDVIRLSDGRKILITSGSCNEPPEGSGIRFRQYSGEEAAK